MIQTIPDYAFYACPDCRGELSWEGSTLACPACRAGYPVVAGIPDFIREDLSRSQVLLLKWAGGHYDRLAPRYERLRYPWRPWLHGGLAAPSLSDVVRLAAGIIPQAHGTVLDAGCGPATLGRRLASPTRRVYGVDVSLGMLRQGAAYVQAGNIPNVRLARALVERLPFRDGSFDAAVCGAALHLFADPGLALAAIGRALKPGAGLAVQTMSARPRGIFRLGAVRRVARSRGAHLFTLAELEDLLAWAGFEDFRPQEFGSIILFTARKGIDPLH